MKKCSEYRHHAGFRVNRYEKYSLIVKTA